MMEYLVTLLLGLLLGILVLYVTKPGYFVKQPHEFQTLELMFEQYMDEMDEKQEAWRAEYRRCCQHLEALSAQGRAWDTPHEAAPDPGAMTGTGETQESRQRLIDSLPAIETLAEQGVQPAEIAQRLELGTGEVGLVLSLKNHRHDS